MKPCPPSCPHRIAALKESNPDPNVPISRSRFRIWHAVLGSFLLMGVIGSILPDDKAPTPAYTGTSVTCSELQSESNAAYARSKAYHSRNLTARSDLDIMKATHARMEEIGCYANE